MTKVLIADDQVLIRAGLAAIVRATPGLEVCGEAGDGEEAVALTATASPDVVVMDIRMPKLDGIQATERILARGGGEGPRVLILTTFDLDDYVYRALRAGASGFLLKETQPDRLLAAIELVADGEMLFAPSVTCRLVQHFTRQMRQTATHRTALAELTAREVDVLRLVGQGLANPEIADELVLSVATVKTHINRTMTKLRLSSRAQAVVVAYESGLIVPGGAGPGQSGLRVGG